MMPKPNLTCTETVKTRIIFKQFQNSFPDDGCIHELLVQSFVNIEHGSNCNRRYCNCFRHGKLPLLTNQKSERVPLGEAAKKRD